MNTRIFNIAAGLLLAVVCCGCGEEDNDFAGTDNYITSFSLEKEGRSYTARIAEGEIKLSVPESADLTGVTVRYSVCENAVISPDPETVSDWNTTRQFTVTSFGGTARNYSYVVTKSKLSESGTVTLLTQAEVDAFGAKGISHIEGHLVIGSQSAGGTDTIRSLRALDGLTEVTGNITICNTFGGTDLDGLANLKRAGNFYVGSATVPAAMTDSLHVSLPSLQRVGEIVLNDPRIKSVVLPQLEAAWSIFVNGRSVSALSLVALKDVAGNLTLQSGTNSSASTANAALKVIEFGALENVRGSLSLQGFTAAAQVRFPRLKTVGANMTVAYLSAMTGLDVNALESIGAKLTLSNLDAYTRPAAPALRSVGELKYEGSYSVRPAVGFELPELARVNGNMELSYISAPELSFAALGTISGELKINYAEQLSSLSLPLLSACGRLYLGGIYKLTAADFSGVKNLAKAELVSGTVLSELKLTATVGEIALNGGSSATALPLLTGLREVTGTMSVTNYKAADITVSDVKRIGTYSQTSGSGQKILAFPELEEIGKLSFSLTDLTTLSAPKLTRAASLDWSNFWALKDVSLGALTEISGELKLWGAGYSGAASNCLLKDLGFLTTVTKVGSVSIKWCGWLEDYSGLKNALPSLGAASWSVTECKYNPTFGDMQDGNYVRP